MDEHPGRGCRGDEGALRMAAFTADRSRSSPVATHHEKLSATLLGMRYRLAAVGVKDGENIGHPTEDTP